MDKLLERRKFIKTVSAATVGFGSMVSFQSCKQNNEPKAIATFERLSRSTPEAQGISSSAISGFLNAANESGLEFHGFMIVRNANVVAEGWWSPFKSSYKHTLYSLSKSFTSTAIGLLFDDGKLSVEDKVLSFFPNDAPTEISDDLASMNIKHLLTMNSGHEVGTMPKMFEAEDGNYVKAFLAQPLSYTPGTHFLYNTGATYMLSAIVNKVTGHDTFDFLTERLFKPLNILDADWQRDPKGISVGGYGLRVQTEDIAKLGQLYLQKGKWNGDQLLSEAWIKQATSKQTESNEGDSDWSQGYGYQFWRCKPAPGFYRGDGAFGQYCIVIPHKNTVIAINGESSDMQKSMDLVWEHILPALTDDAKLPKNDKAHKALQTSIASLSLAVVDNSVKSELAKSINNKTYQLAKNKLGAKKVKFDINDDQCRLTIDFGSKTQSYTAGFGKWIIDDNNFQINSSPLTTHDSLNTKSAACAGWTDENTLLLNFKMVEAIHSELWTCKFDKDKLNLSFKSSNKILRNPDTDFEPWQGTLA